jgi:small multidrug resistance pump
VQWLYLMLAIGFEVAGTTCMKMSDGLTKLVPAVLVFVFYGISLTALTLALKFIDVSIAYAIWSGLGTALIAAIGVIWFREAITPLKIGALVLIIAGVVALNLSGEVH